VKLEYDRENDTLRLLVYDNPNSEDYNHLIILDKDYIKHIKSGEK